MKQFRSMWLVVSISALVACGDPTRASDGSEALASVTSDGIARCPGITSITITDLGTLPGGSFSQATAINNRGQVVGYGDTPSGTRAFLWTRVGGMQSLPGLRTSPFTIAFDINNKGQVAGWSFINGVGRRAFLWTPGRGVRNLGTLPGGSDSEAYGLNDKGHVVGVGTTAAGASHAFVWTPEGGMRDLGVAGRRYSSSGADDINDRGIVAGSNYDETYSGRATLWKAAGATRLLLPRDSRATTVNDFGVAAGERDGRAFRWSAKDGVQDLGTLPGSTSSVAYHHNNCAQVVGESRFPGYFVRAFLWTPGRGMRALGTLPGYRESVANAINERGQVVGFSSTLKGSKQHAVLWTLTGTRAGAGDATVASK